MSNANYRWTTARRLRQLRETLRAGNLPKINRYLPGAADVVREFGLEPMVDVFIPRPDWDSFTPEQRAKIRNAWRRQRQYQREKLDVGETVTTKRQLLQRRADSTLREELIKK